METILIVIHLLLSISLIGLILIQHGKGADMGAAFGSGASATVFGARGSASFLSRSTAVLATLFFVTSLALAYFASQATDRPGLMDLATPPPPAVEVAPEGEVPVPLPGEADIPAADESAVPVVGAPTAAQEEVPAVGGPEEESATADSATPVEGAQQ